MRLHSGLALYGVAVADKRLGDSRTATKVFADFLMAWKNADAGFLGIEHGRGYLMAHRA